MLQPVQAVVSIVSLLKVKVSCTDRFTVDSEILLSCGRCLPAGDIQLVLGGQHMCAIVKELWLAVTSPIEQGGQAVAESDVPREMRFIYGVILREDTPMEICRLAAGLHQRAQREFCETTFCESGCCISATLC